MLVEPELILKKKTIQQIRQIVLHLKTLFRRVVIVLQRHAQKDGYFGGLQKTGWAKFAQITTLISQWKNVRLYFADNARDSATIIQATTVDECHKGYV